MSRVHIVHIGPDPAGQGGMAAVMRGLLATSFADGYEQHLIVTYRTAEPWPRMVTFAGALGQVVRACLRREPIVLHVHMTMRGSVYRKSVVVAAARLLRRPVLLHLHSGAGDIEDFGRRIGPGRRWTFARAFAAADRCVSVSAAGAAQLGRSFGVRDATVLPHAPPAGVETPVAQLADGTPPRVLYLGGFDRPAKGGEVLVDALPRLLAAVPGVEIELAGIGAPPPQMAPLLDGGAVRWHGYLDEPGKHAAFARSPLFVLPSISEGLPVALLEAMAHGRAIVATRMGGIPELLTDGVDAVLVPPGDPEALADAVAALAQDPERVHRLGRAARARADRLTAEEVGDRLAALYAELARGRAGMGRP